MAVYAFDFDEVARTRKELDSVANNLEQQLKNGTNKLMDETSEWTGDASNSFDNLTEDNYSTIASEIDTIRGMSSYLGEVSDVISQAESDLASMQI